MGDIARMSVQNEDCLYSALGINAELLIDHAWGWEPTDIATVKAYRPESNSLTSGQVLAEPYDTEKAVSVRRYDLVPVKRDEHSASVLVIGVPVRPLKVFRIVRAHCVVCSFCIYIA